MDHIGAAGVELAQGSAEQEDQHTDHHADAEARRDDDDDGEPRHPRVGSAQLVANSNAARSIKAEKEFKLARRPESPKVVKSVVDLTPTWLRCSIPA